MTVTGVMLSNDTKRSVELGSAYQHCVKPKSCYNNVFHIHSEIGEAELKRRGWRIAYGYVHVADSLMVRHAFFLEGEGVVIDPTVIHLRQPAKKRKYLLFHVFDTIDDYTEKLMEEVWNPDLYRSLETYEQPLLKWGEENAIVLYR